MFFPLVLDVMKVINRFFLVMLAFVVFATSSCFAVDVHICEGKVQSQVFFGSADACEQMAEMEKKNFHHVAKRFEMKRSHNHHQKACLRKRHVALIVLSNTNWTKVVSLRILQFCFFALMEYWILLF